MRESFSFTLLLDGADLALTSVLDALYTGGCVDATFGVQRGIAFADFDREAGSLTEAVLSAIADVESAVPGLQVIRVEPEDFVSASDIANRTGRTRASISQLIDGLRGPADFPVAALRLGDNRLLWRWPDVVEWFGTSLGQPVGTSAEAHAVAALNGALDIRRHARALPEAATWRIIKWTEGQMAASS